MPRPIIKECPASGDSKTASLPSYTVDTPAEARQFLGALIDVLGLAFHPDTSVTQYEDDYGEPTFRPLECRRLQSLIDQCFEQLPDVYEVSIDIWEEKGLIK